jgi:site-specific DNA-methyltransferase (adenine-specific)
MIYLDNSVEWIKKHLYSNSVDLIVTSPPYKDEDGWTEDLIYQASLGWQRVLKPGGLLFLNFGHLAEDKFRPFKTAEIIMSHGVFKLNETITWVKNHYRPIQGSKRLNNLSEFIFLFYKDEMPDLDRLAIGVPYADKSNAKRFAGGRDLKCGGNVWYINYETITDSSQKLHNDRFPLELPERCIKLSGLKRGLVLDPFSGSGTTCFAAKKLGFEFIGIEQNPSHVRTSIERLTLIPYVSPVGEIH